MKKIIVIIIIILLLCEIKLYSQSTYSYQTSSYICHNRDYYGNWANEQVGYANLLIVVDIDNEIISFTGSNSNFVYHIMSSYSRNSYPYTYYVYDCMYKNVPFEIVISYNSVNGNTSIT